MSSKYSAPWTYTTACAFASQGNYICEVVQIKCSPANTLRYRSATHLLPGKCQVGKRNSFSPERVTSRNDLPTDGQSTQLVLNPTLDIFYMPPLLSIPPSTHTLYMYFPFVAAQPRSQPTLLAVVVAVVFNQWPHLYDQGRHSHGEVWCRNAQQVLRKMKTDAIS